MLRLHIRIPSRAHFSQDLFRTSAEVKSSDGRTPLMIVASLASLAQGRLINAYEGVRGFCER